MRKTINLSKRIEFLLRFFVIAVSISLLCAQSIYFIHNLSEDKHPWDFFFQQMQSTTSVPTHKIALFLGADIPALQSQKQGILDFLEAQGITIEEQTFYHQGNLQLLSSQIKSAIEKQPDLFFTIGTLASQTVHEMLIKRDSAIPLVFSGVMQPIKSGLSKTTGLTGYNSTGLAEDYNNSITAFINGLQTIRPNIKKIAIVYNPSSASLNEQVDELSIKLEAKNISFKIISVENCGEVYEKTRGSLDETIEAVVILRDYITTSALPALVRACNDVGSTLFVSDAHSVEQGAAAGYCVDEYEIGLIIGSSIARILKDKTPIKELPMIYLDASKLCSLRLNPFALHKQGISTPLEVLLSLPDVVVTHRTK